MLIHPIGVSNQAPVTIGKTKPRSVQRVQAGLLVSFQVLADFVGSWLFVSADVSDPPGRTSRILAEGRCTAVGKRLLPRMVFALSPRKDESDPCDGQPSYYNMQFCGGRVPSRPARGSAQSVYRAFFMDISDDCTNREIAQCILMRSASTNFSDQQHFPKLSFGRFSSPPLYPNAGEFTTHAARIRTDPEKNTNTKSNKRKHKEETKKNKNRNEENTHIQKRTHRDNTRGRRGWEEVLGCGWSAVGVVRSR